jgi:general secretion pathway protein G
MISKRTATGFTLIEVLVVLAVLGTLMMLVAPRYMGSLDRSKEVVLKENLAVVRDAIDKHVADTGRYPESLQELVSKRYLRRLPIDPLTDRTDTWLLVPPADAKLGGVYDIRSGAAGLASDGTEFRGW